MDQFEDDAMLHVWDQRIESLKQWKHQHGHCAVPKNAGLLGRWTSRQRELAKKGRLSNERMSELESIGFVWDANETAWEARYTSLLEYYNFHRHSCVPSAYPGLGIWVAKLRGKRRRGKLSQERIAKLDALEFVWSPSESEWMEKYQALKRFWKTHGHCSVPFRDGDLEKLGWWCNTQRQSRRKGKISAHRVRLLDQIGFVWKPQGLASSRDRHGPTAAKLLLSCKRSRDLQMCQGECLCTQVVSETRSWKRLKREPDTSDTASSTVSTATTALSEVMILHGSFPLTLERRQSRREDLLQGILHYAPPSVKRSSDQNVQRATSPVTLPPIQNLTAVLAHRLEYAPNNPKLNPSWMMRHHLP
jgi:hypothetical protein